MNFPRSANQLSSSKAVELGASRELAYPRVWDDAVSRWDDGIDWWDNTGAITISLSGRFARATPDGATRIARQS